MKVKEKRFGPSERLYLSPLNLTERTTSEKQPVFTNFTEFDLPKPPVCLQKSSRHGYDKYCQMS